MMNFLLLFVFLASATAFFEPGVDLHSVCDLYGAAQVTTYDGLPLAVTSAQKTLVSRWGAKLEENQTMALDKCRFQIRVVTNFASNGDLFIDWLGFGIGVHPNPNKGNSKNIVLSQSTNSLLFRGNGIKTPEEHFLDVVPFSYSDGSDLVVFVFLNRATNQISLRSTTCQYAIDWFPQYDDTQLIFHAGDYYKDGKLEGMCGTCDDNAANDMVSCPGYIDGQGVPLSTIEEVSDSCRSGNHQG